MSVLGKINRSRGVNVSATTLDYSGGRIKGWVVPIKGGFYACAAEIKTKGIFKRKQKINYIVKSNDLGVELKSLDGAIEWLNNQVDAHLSKKGNIHKLINKNRR